MQLLHEVKYRQNAWTILRDRSLVSLCQVQYPGYTVVQYRGIDAKLETLLLSQADSEEDLRV